MRQPRRLVKEVSCTECDVWVRVAMQIIAEENVGEVFTSELCIQCLQIMAQEIEEFDK